MRLSDVETGQTVTIVKVIGYGSFRKRILEMGFIKGQTVTVILNAPLKDPIVYKVMNYEVSLRRNEAAMIEVVAEHEITENGYVKCCDRDVASSGLNRVVECECSKKSISIALVGNPNSGKTSLFNAISGGNEHVGNYGGVTVDAKKGEFKYNEYNFVVYDLPGTYALSAYTPEENYVREHINNMMPDVIVNVVAASNIERNLYLTTELIDMDLYTVVALNMYDEVESSNAKLDYQMLGKLMGVPMVPTSSKSGAGLTKLFDTIIEVFENHNETTRHIHVNHGATIENGISKITNLLVDDEILGTKFSRRYLAIKFLERDKRVDNVLRTRPNYDKWVAIRDREVESIESILGEDIDSAIVEHKYGFIAGALRETFEAGSDSVELKMRTIDSIVTHRFLGFPIFLFLMWFMFEVTFTLGSYPMGWIESVVGWLSGYVDGVMSDGILKDLIVDGIIGGVGGVIIFLPNIVILYSCISLMEDSGYMARAAFIMDKIMHKIGLHGKSFIPMIMGFGCNVPAIIAARSIESHSSRLITILINPFISCGARLPVYILLAGTFFAQHAGVVMMGLYILGILVALLTAKLLRRFMFKQDETPFVMELPPYRVPTIKSTFVHMWDKSSQYLRKMGGVILIASIVIWALSYFPRGEGDYQQQSESYIGQIGQAITPVMKPLGFDWQMNVAILTGVVAKEVVVSTFGVLYANNAEADEKVLSERLTAINPDTGKPNMTPITALTFMVFVLLYFPCIATVVTVAKETGHWKWGVFSMVYTCAMAWVLAFVVRQICLIVM